MQTKCFIGAVLFNESVNSIVESVWNESQNPILIGYKMPWKI